MDQRQQPKLSEPAQSEAAPAQRSEIPAGTVIGGRYKVQRLLGQGGFGRSYLATDAQRFDEPCVLKEFVPANQAGRTLQKAVELFKKEAKVLYQVEHPQIPKFLAGFTQAQRLFIVQQYINGVTYAQLLRQRKQQGQVFSEGEVIQWLYNLLPVLDYLHGLNLIHRDISPDNVMFSRDRGLPVLIDFGLVKDCVGWDPDTDTTDFSSRTSMVGKFGYSPPEQLRMGRCYPSSDLYSLGVTAIVLLTGKSPNSLIDSDSLQWIWPSFVELKTPLKQVLDRLVKPQPKERYQTAREVLTAMQRLSLANVAVNLPAANIPLRPPAVGAGENPGLKPAVSAGEGSPFSAPSGPALTTSAFVEQCRQELARLIGPIAHVLVDDILTQYPYITPVGFVETLTSHLTDPEQAIAFKRRIKIPKKLVSDSQSLINPRSHGGGSGESAGTSATSASTSQPGLPIPSSLDAAFVEDCRQKLIDAIGPLANLLLKKALTNNPQIDRVSLVETLAAQIPDAKRAEKFRQQLQSVN
jgi:serine/threonine-protein kinase